MAQWNRVAMVSPTSPPVSIVTSDASGQWGCRAWHNHEWFQYHWPSGCEHYHIAFLFGALLAEAEHLPGWEIVLADLIDSVLSY